MSNLETSSLSPPDGELPLTFEAWAELSARLSNLSQDERFDILAERQVKLDIWQQCDQHYLVLVAREIGQGRYNLAEKYASASSAEMERRKKAAAPPASPPAEVAVPGTEAATIPAQQPASDTAVPSFLQPRDLGSPAMAPALSPQVQLTRENLAATAAAFEMPTALRPKAADALPFRAGATPSIAMSPGEPKPPRVRSPVVGATAMDPSSDPSSTLPFAKAASEPAHVAYRRMPLQTHALFCAELAVFPDKTAEILQKYQVSEEAARAALERDWRARLDAHPDTKAEWDKAFATYCDGLRQQRR